ncbi:MAG: LysM peptidoglycan-binding domain-containing protein, partial [Candidatus Dormibacteraeota bacterium]|nr:LysM peptidoglycan-binding domain-containing protein [Candidatus Dormibacteraeota bacterium]MBO0762028.1 LysM peptidoglycan-binding domain-containing protein [Candidatus Dormibacteraeota bacterium]
MRLATHAVVIVIAIGFVSYSWIARATAAPEQPVGSSSAPAASLAQGGQVGDLQVGRSGTIVKPAGIPTSGPVPRTATSYKVGANDTLDSVAQRFNVSPEQVRWSNPQLLSNSDEVDPGETLAIPPIAGVV